MEVDTDDKRMRCWPCDYDHVKWCMIVGFGSLQRKVSELRRAPKSYRQKADEYLTWGSGNFMRSTFGQANNGLFALQCLYDWETKGVSLPTELEDPEILSGYVQGKKNREWHITEWLEGVEQGLFLPEEFLGTLGMTEKVFESVFRRQYVGL